MWVFFMASFLPFPLFQMFIAETDRETRDGGAELIFIFEKKYLGGREREKETE